MNDVTQYLVSLDYIAIGIYVLLMAVIGLSLGKFVKDTNAYFKASGTVPWVMAGISSFFSLFSTFVFVAYAGIAYNDGLVAVTVFWATVPACIIGGSVFAKRWKRTGHVTPMQYVEERYGLPVQQTITWVTLIMRFLDNMVRIYAIGLFIVVVTPLSLGWSIVISGIIYTTFNLVGGLWSIVVMSIVQFIVLALITLILLSLSLTEVGGLAGVYEKIPEHMSWFNGEKGRPSWLIVFYIMTLFNYNQKWTFIQKFYCVRDEKAAIKVGILSGLLFFIFMPVFLFPAVTSRILLPDIADPEMSYILLSKALLPSGLMGVLVASMFASTMSTVNGEFNTMAGVVTNDVYKKIFNPSVGKQQLLAVARLSIVFIGTIVTLGAIYIGRFGGAFEANKIFMGIFAIPIGVPFLFGLFFKRPTSIIAVITILTGVICGVVLNMSPSISWELATSIELLVCLIIYFVPGYIVTQRSDDKMRVERFFHTLSVPIEESDKPHISPEYNQTMTRIFVFSLVVSGVLFIGISFFSFQSLGGKLSLAAGLLCLAGAFCWYLLHGIRENRRNRME